MLVAHGGGAPGSGAAEEGASVVGTAEAHMVLSPNGEAGAVHVGGALGVHGGITVVDGGLTVLGNHTAATVYSCDEDDPLVFDCPPGTAVAVGGDEMILVDSGARTINLGGPGAVEITMKGGMTIDATDADGVVRPISMSNLHVTGDASLGAVGTDTLTINAAVTATSDFAILPADPTAGEHTAAC